MLLDNGDEAPVGRISCPRFGHLRAASGAGEGIDSTLGVNGWAQKMRPGEP